jgi:thioredoxin reductase (NADPH)
MPVGAGPVSRAGSSTTGTLNVMSRYLVDRITGLSNVEVLTQTAISGLDGSGGIFEAARWRGPSRDDLSEEMRRPVRHLFLLIGADPNTDWLKGSGAAIGVQRLV